eukprot:2543481-Rhodomonas_salina.2
MVVSIATVHTRNRGWRCPPEEVRSSIHYPSAGNSLGSYAIPVPQFSEEHTLYRYCTYRRSIRYPISAHSVGAHTISVLDI